MGKTQRRDGRADPAWRETAGVAALVTKPARQHRGAIGAPATLAEPEARCLRPPRFFAWLLTAVRPISNPGFPACLRHVPARNVCEEPAFPRTWRSKDPPRHCRLA